MSDTTRFLVIVKLSDTRPDRLVVLVPRLQDQLTRLSKAQPEQAFRAVNADVFGYFIQSNLRAAQIVAAIESPGKATTSDIEPILDGNDAVFVMEIGNDFHPSRGFTRAGVWLQRN